MPNSFHVYIEDAPCHGVAATAIWQRQELAQIEGLYRTAGVQDWMKHLYEFSPWLDGKIYIARVTRTQPDWKKGRDFWVVLREGVVSSEHLVTKMTLRNLLKELYQTLQKND